MSCSGQTVFVVENLISRIRVYRPDFPRAELVTNIQNLAETSTATFIHVAECCLDDVRRDIKLPWEGKLCTTEL